MLSNEVEIFNIYQTRDRNPIYKYDILKRCFKEFTHKQQGPTL